MIAFEMNYIRTSALAIIQRGDELLVVRYEDEKGPWYVLPGGGQHHGESLEAALLREVEEETGARITVGPLRFVRESVAGPGGGRSMPPGFHQVELVFACELVTQPVGGSVPDPTQVSVEWRSASELHLCFFPQALLGALQSKQPLAYLGIV